jgi:Domain of unknown function (DUF5071)
MQHQKYTLALENVLDFTMSSIMAGDLYLVDQHNNRTLLCGLVMKNYQFIENGDKVLMPVLRNRLRAGVSNWCVQIGIADLKTETIVFYNKFFRNNGENITYENGIVSVVNEHNECVKTSSFDTFTPIERTEKFEIVGRNKRYFKRFWAENRGDAYSSWGESWWFFETDSDGVILRQIEEYANGIVQCYDLISPNNRFGGLGELPLLLDEFKEYDIFREDFESVWAAHYGMKESNLYSLLIQMFKHPAHYLGEKSLSALWHFVNGYTSACHIKGIEEGLKPRWHLFHEFVKRKTRFGESTSGWKNMILTHCKGDEEKALDVFFDYFFEFKKGTELDQFIKKLVPKDKHDMDFDAILDFHWFYYEELKPIIPDLLTWLQDLNWPVAKPISGHLKTMLPDILTELRPILESEDGVWKYNILKVFFIDTESEHYTLIQDVIEKLAFSPSENDEKEEVNLLAQEILRGYYLTIK